MTDPDSETCPACGERATVETYRSTRPGEGEFLITQWRCPNVAKRLTRTQLLLGKNGWMKIVANENHQEKPKQGTHPMHKVEQKIESEEAMYISPELEERIKSECKRAGISVNEFARRYLDFNPKSLSAHLSGASLSPERLASIEAAVSELAAATDFHSPSALVEKPSDVFLDDQVDQAEAPPEVAPPDESPSEIWVATSRQDLLDQAVAILRKVPLVDRPHLLEIVYRQEQLEQMQAEFRKKLLGA